MADMIINAKFTIRNDIKINWNNINPVLSKGEMGIEIDTGKFKFGDGVLEWNLLDYISTNSVIIKNADPTSNDDSYDVGIIWINSSTKKSYLLLDNSIANAVWKQIVTFNDLSDLGTGDMLKSNFATNDKVDQGYVDKSILSDSSAKLSNGRTISILGDGVGISPIFDGSKNVEIPFILSDSGVTSGSYTKVIVDSKGRITSGNNLEVSDIPDLTLDKITDIGTAAKKNTGKSSGDIPVIGDDGKLDVDLFPSIAITEVFEVSNDSEMTSLKAQTGDIAVRSDLNKSFILKSNDPTVLDNWILLKTPTDMVLSVNGDTGVIRLTSDKIPENINLYYTEERATSNFDKNIALTSSSSLLNGDKILLSTDTYVFDGGNA